ncbi:RNA degradosome polyphosphate kinase [Tumebacillus sp. ITR2]|uniref:Polyphosphate kinase n=1 Tax=Tumebacillus amylolyticus TaxID=2801339 RepID=A0ABS1JBG9_9BACL|nr:RNA degradosome polyphosphate kinase [Tumebacillus amylolyticus]MBL0387585.1 RNA degradosome polyphosphate kinase [Tumebacillus amylolyticus]
MKQHFDLPTYYINRELSWLSFNERVMEEATDTSNPLLERLKFLAIASSNLDEFFMVRVAGILDLFRTGSTKPESKAGMTPAEQLGAIAQRVHPFVERMYSILDDHIWTELHRENIRFLKPIELNAEQEAFLEDYYERKIFPVLTPLAVDASHPFPHLANKSLNLGVLLQADHRHDQHHHKPKHLFAVVQVPSVIPRFLELPTDDSTAKHYILLEDVICQHMKMLFSGHKIIESAAFRITRDADMSFDEETTENLVQEIQKELKKRRMGVAVRLEIAATMSETLREMLTDWLDLTQHDIYEIDGPIDPTFFMKFYNALPGVEHLKFDEFESQPPHDFIGENGIFEAIQHKDILVFHPYESFDPVLHFISQAADDPNVLAIKQTLYRVGGNSPIVSALARAAENGKQVTVLLEIKARFDEENNIVWAKKLEKAGCHVIYGLVGLKTHSKITLVVRQEGHQLRRYVHLSTGNYNEVTARIYTDLGMFSAREELGYDATEFFNHLTGYGNAPDWEEIVTAPIGLKQKLLDMIDREIEVSTIDKPGLIIAKMNSLTDKDLIKALYRASCAGVRIELIIRGICCLRPGLEDVSEHIQVSSIVGRFLEHSRVFYFQNGGDEEVYLSSADWMTRNMEHRIEILFPVKQEDLRERLVHILNIQLKDNVKRHVLHPDGTYHKVRPGHGVWLDSQMYLAQEAEQFAQAKEMQTYVNRLVPKTHVK